MAFRFAAPVVVSFGEEDFFLDRDARAFREQPERAVIELDGSETSEADLVDVCSTVTMDARPRVVVVDNAQGVKPGSVLKAYVEGLDARDVSKVLALVFRSGKLPAFWTKLAGKAQIREHKKLKTFETNNEVVKWISEEAKSLQLVVDSRIAAILFQVVGADLYRLSSELRKIRLLLDKGGTVTIDHLRLVVSPTATAEPFQVAEAAANKDPKRALDALSMLYKNGADDPTVPVAYSLMRQVEKLMVACALLKKGASDDEIAARLEMHPWRCRTFFIPMAKKHSVASLANVMRELCKLDVEIKRTGASKRTLLELTVLSLAAQ
jgi:DNA polymerase-3 subunit delta